MAVDGGWADSGRRLVAPAGLARLAARYAGLLGLVVLIGALHIRHRPATLCLLRATTGVPCPFCGGTTSAAALGSGDVAAAFRASLIAPFMLVAAPMLGIVESPAWWRPRRRRWGVILGILVVAEVWQLRRLHLL